MNFCNCSRDKEDENKTNTMLTSTTIVPLVQFINTGIGLSKQTNLWSVPTCCEKMAKQKQPHHHDHQNHQQQQATSQQKISDTISEQRKAIDLEIPYSLLRSSLNKLPTNDGTTVMSESTISSLVDVEEDLEELFHNNEVEDPQVISSKNTRSRRKQNYSVRFSTVEIRQYKQCIGDSPAVTEGPPISLSWEYNPDEVQKYNLNEYEDIILNGKERRREDELIIPRRFRERRLRDDLGYSLIEIQSVMKEVNISRNERLDTIKSSFYLAGIEEWYENLQKILIGNPIRKATYSILGNWNQKVQHLKQCEEFTSISCQQQSTIDNVQKAN